VINKLNKNKEIVKITKVARIVNFDFLIAETTINAKLEWQFS